MTNRRGGHRTFLIVIGVAIGPLASAAGGALPPLGTFIDPPPVEATSPEIDAPASPIKPIEPDQGGPIPEALVEGAQETPSVWSGFLDGWVRRAEMGSSGTEGNTRSGSFRGSLRASRDVGLNKIAADATYQYASRDSETTEDRFTATGRFDHLMVDSRWRYFASGSYESDRFRDWDHRWTSGGGFGFQAIGGSAGENDTNLLARGGLSLAQDIGGFEEDIRTEAIMGLDLTHQFNERQKLTGSIDFLPNVDGFEEYRLNARAGWEFLIDPESNLSLRIGGEERFDATATGGSKRNDLSYFAVLAVEF